MRERPCAAVAGSCGQPLALIKGTCSSDPRSCPSSATMWLSSAAECRTPCRKHFLQCGNRPGHSPHIINQAPYASTIHCRLGDDEGVVGTADNQTGIGMSDQDDVIQVIHFQHADDVRHVCVEVNGRTDQMRTVS